MEDEDDCWESDIGTVLEYLEDRGDLEEGFFSYVSEFANCKDKNEEEKK